MNHPKNIKEYVVNHVINHLKKEDKRIRYLRMEYEFLIQDSQSTIFDLHNYNQRLETNIRYLRQLNQRLEIDTQYLRESVKNKKYNKFNEKLNVCIIILLINFLLMYLIN